MHNRQIEISSHTGWFKETVIYKFVTALVVYHLDRYGISTFFTDNDNQDHMPNMYLQYLNMNESWIIYLKLGCDNIWIHTTIW